MGRYAWAENPPSRTRRLVTNVRILREDSDGVEATANFAVHRFRGNVAEAYVGRYVYGLVRRDGGWKIRRRVAILDLETLRPHGKLSIIL